VSAVGNSVIGLLKGMGHTASSLGEAVTKIPGVATGIDTLYGKPGLTKSAFAAANEMTQPTTTAQKVGYGAEQAAEFLAPGAAAEDTAAKLAGRYSGAIASKFSNAPRLIQAGAQAAPQALTQGAAAAGTAAAQGGNPVAAGVMGAAGPVGQAALGSAADALGAQANKLVMQALGPTKERYKAMAQRLVPRILSEGIRGSREDVLAQATDAAWDAGQDIEKTLDAVGSRQIGTQPLVDALENAKNAFRTTATKPLMSLIGNKTAQILKVDPQARTATVAVNFEPRAIAQLDKLKTVVQDLGGDASVTQLVAIRRAWDRVVDQAGGFAQRAPGAIGMPLKDTTEAWAKREATGAIRQLLDENVPELTKINKEFSFWKNLQDVLTQTVQRTTPQKPGLGTMIAQGAGQAVGGVVGSPGGPGTAVGGAVALGQVAKLANSVFSSPRWKFASAQMKDSLARAIMNGNVGELTSVLSRLGAGAASQIPQE
jgi:hypothetical protein